MCRVLVITSNIPIPVRISVGAPEWMGVTTSGHRALREDLNVSDDLILGFLDLTCLRYSVGLFLPLRIVSVSGSNPLKISTLRVRLGSSRYC